MRSRVAVLEEEGYLVHLGRPGAGDGGARVAGEGWCLCVISREGQSVVDADAPECDGAVARAVSALYRIRSAKDPALIEAWLERDGWHAISRSGDGRFVAGLPECSSKQEAFYFAYDERSVYGVEKAWIIERRSGAIVHHEEVLPDVQ